MFDVLHERPGPHWEKRGNTAWLGCRGCGTWFPVTPDLLQGGAPPCRCPGCGREGGTGPDRGEHEEEAV
jgi:hypothetical protein